MADAWDDISVPDPQSAPGGGQADPWDAISVPAGAPPSSAGEAPDGVGKAPQTVEPRTGLFLSQNEHGEIGPGILTKPFVAGMELVRHGYQPDALRKISSEQDMPDIQGIKLAAEAAPAAMSGTTFTNPTRQSIGREVASHEAWTKQVGPHAQAAYAPSGVPKAWLDKYGSTNPREAVVAAGERQGVKVPGFVASESSIPKNVAGGLGAQWGVGEVVNSATRNMADDMGERVATLANNATREASVPGANVKGGILDWTVKGFRQAMDDTYKPLDAVIKPDTEVPLSATMRAANALSRADRESASQDGQRVITLVDEALKRGKLTWAGLKELRTRVGERVHGDIAPEAGTSARALDRIYAALTEDVRFGVGQAGRGVKGGGVQKAQAEFDAANKKAGELFDLRRRLTEVVGREGDNSAESVFHRVVAMAGSTARADQEQLARALTAAGPARQTLVDSVVARLGIDEKTGAFSPERFLTDYNKRLSDEGKKLLFGPTTKAHLDDIAKLSEAWTDAKRYGNSSGTARGMGLATAAFSAMTHPLLLIGEIAGGVGISWLLARPAGARAAEQFMSTYTRAAINPAERAAFEVASRNLHEIVNRANAAPSEFDAKGKEKVGARDAPPRKTPNAMVAPPAGGNAMAEASRSLGALKEGATATNPATGERIQLKGGAWRPLQ